MNWGVSNEDYRQDDEIDPDRYCRVTSGASMVDVRGRAPVAAKYNLVASSEAVVSSVEVPLVRVDSSSELLSEGSVTMNLAKMSKALTAGVVAGVAAFVPLASGATRWAIVADLAVAVGAGVAAFAVTYAAPKNAE